jgi:hypothetical protein
VKLRIQVKNSRVRLVIESPTVHDSVKGGSAHAAITQPIPGAEYLQRKSVRVDSNPTTPVEATFDPLGAVALDNLKTQQVPQRQVESLNDAEAGMIRAAGKPVVNFLPAHCNTKERRSESRIVLDAPALMIPLASVTARLCGRVLNLSRHGVKVRTDEPLEEPPRTGDAYRIRSGDDVMLCEVRYYRLLGAGDEVGFKILHRFSTGELSRLIQAH